MTTPLKGHNDYPELNLREIELHAITWAERYQEIEEISLYRSKTDESFKYAFIVTVSNPDYPYLNWAGVGCIHIQNDLSSFYKDQPPGDFLDHWFWCDIEHNEQIPSEFVIEDTKLSLYARQGVKSKPKRELECENFVRALRFQFENENEVKIREPGRKPKTYNHERLGFDRATTDEWEWFMRMIKGSDCFYRYGPSRRGHQKVKAYDTNRGRLGAINKKLVGFFKREYGVEFPAGFKVHEKVPTEGPGVHKFKFQIGTKVEKSEYEGYTKEDILAKISNLSKQVHRVSNIDDPAKQAELTESLLVAATLAQKKGWITERRMAEILDQKWTPQEQTYASPKRFPDSDSIP